MATTIEQEAVQDSKRANQNTKRVMTHQDIKTGALGESPYTAKNLDGAIAHLEIVVAVDDNIAVFGRRYWRDRVERIASTPQIVPAQARRLRHLLDQLGDV
ncbi:hypothetical protein LMG28688_06703 [Paraburkholderia caffeinitolerans]|uniref:Uncharacterized protein n=1 Tax=Paraburkholderia caffeinitolerans TaxID=1723730 RepID=A0A6J5H079_9BURK|nr:hypothetical protein [Paraburkholderia caffeinitolerans]CAB3808162.1 hypothetical protein LMG28688_06703 [Paraburkholderia caffeinitolerans]